MYCEEKVGNIDKILEKESLPGGFKISMKSQITICDCFETRLSDIICRPKEIFEINIYMIHLHPTMVYS